jgi:hypothetical protein
MTYTDTPIFDLTPNGALSVSDESELTSQLPDYFIEAILENLLGGYDV